MDLTVGGAGVVSPSATGVAVMQANLPSGVWGQTSPGGGGGPPAPPQLVGSINPDIYADFVNGSYLGGGAAQSTFATWLAAIGGTFSRGSSATYIDGGIVKTAVANVPRIGANGIRLTDAAINLTLQSANLANAAWTASPTAPTANAGVAPDGTTTAASLIPPIAAPALYFVQQPSTVVASSTATQSLFVKPIGGFRWVYFDFYMGSDNRVWFDLVNGVVGTKEAGLTSAAITPLANGWFLISCTGPTTATSLYLSVRPADADFSTTFTGNGAAGFYVWGAQTTQTAFLCDYIPTTTATVTQTADALSFPYAQTTMSALAVVNGQLVNSAGDAVVLGCAQYDAPIYIHLLSSFFSINNVNFVASGPFASPLAVNKAMVAGSPTGRSITCNGQAPVSDANKLLSAAPASLVLGSYVGGFQLIYGNINQVAIWNGVVASAADMIYLTGGPAPPSWLPVAGNAYATIYADYIGGRYWYNGQQANFSAWLSALGGAFSRGSNATYIDGGIVKTAASNVARIGSSGIRLTGAATNSALQSNNFSNATWVLYGGGAPVQNATGPDGVAASAWTFPASGGIGSTLYQSLALPAGSFLSMFAKAGTSSFAYISAWDAGGTRATWFNLATGTVGTVNGLAGGTPVIAQSAPVMVPVGNGWYLCGVYTSGAALAIFQVGASDADATSVSAGTNAISVYGAQATQTAFQCDYTPTAGATVTQAADNLSFPYTQTTLSALVNMIGANQASGFNSVQLATQATEYLIYFTGGTTSFQSYQAVNGSLTGPVVTMPWANLHKAMAAGSPTGRSLTSDGSAPTSDAHNLVTTTPTSLYLGQGGGNFSYANYQQLAIWNGLVASAADMQRLTTLPATGMTGVLDTSLGYVLPPIMG